MSHVMSHVIYQGWAPLLVRLKCYSIFSLREVQTFYLQETPRFQIVLFNKCLVSPHCISRYYGVNIHPPQKSSISPSFTVRMVCLGSVDWSVENLYVLSLYIVLIKSLAWTRKLVQSLQKVQAYIKCIFSMQGLKTKQI